MKSEYKGLETKLIHGGEPKPRVEGSLILPIFQTSTFQFRGEDDYHDIRYLRLNNSPNHVSLGEKLAMIEHTEVAMVTSSGMSAISAAVMANAKAGDHVMCHNSLYGGTNGLFTKDLPQWGITPNFVDAGDPSTWKGALTPETKIFYVESITNPITDVGCLKEVAAFAKEHGLISMIDNTFASPVNFTPADLGFDIVLHSATKYLNGHSDICAGVIAGKQEMMENIVHVLNHLGGCLDPNSCFLLQRGLKTLSLRVRAQNENAMAVARFLETHPKVTSVRYPGLESHPHHERAKELFNGGFGGMLSFDIEGGQEASKKVLSNLNLMLDAPSLGGIESLVCIPTLVTHVNLSREDRDRSSITDSLIRVSVGIESTDELVEDIKQALDRI